MLPPALDRSDGELGGVMVDADRDPALVTADVVDAIRDRLAQLLVDEVVRAHQLGLAAGPPLAPAVLEIADQLLLFGVDADHRLAGIERDARHGGDMRELRVAVGVRAALAALAVGLQAVAACLQTPLDRARRDLVTGLAQLLGQLGHAAAPPAPPPQPGAPPRPGRQPPQRPPPP